MVQLLSSISDPAVRALPAGHGSIEQRTDNVDLLAQPHFSARDRLWRYLLRRGAGSPIGHGPGSLVHPGWTPAIVWASDPIALVELTTADIERMAELITQFVVVPLAAPSFGGGRCRAPRVREIATLDRRHSPSIAPKDEGHFNLLPKTASVNAVRRGQHSGERAACPGGPNRT
ncbi:MAG: hypothetical protein ACRCYU_17465 [Nocardioides sp.]